MSYLIESLEIADNPIVLFRGIVGSRAYGTQNANSDTDVRGIFVVPSAEYAHETRTVRYASRSSATRSALHRPYHLVLTLRFRLASARWCASFCPHKGWEIWYNVRHGKEWAHTVRRGGLRRTVEGER